MKRVPSFFLLSVVASLSTGAFAQEAAQADSPDDAAQETDAEAAKRQELVELVQQGAGQYDSEDYAAAIQAFQKAYGIKASPTIGVYLGHAYRESHQYGAALEVYKTIAETPVDEDTHPKIVEAIEEAKAAHEELSEGVSQVTMVVAGPDEFDVLFNGTQVAPYKGQYIVRPGDFTVTVRADGYVDRVVPFTAEAGRRPLLEVKLEKKEPAVAAAAPPPPEPKPQAASPLATGPTDPAADVKPAHARTGYKILGWASVGFGAVGLAGGGGLVMWGSVEDSTARDMCQDDICPPEARQSIDNAKMAGDLATISFAVGGGLLATGVTILIVEKATRPKQQAALSNLSVALHPTGLSLRGAL